MTTEYLYKSYITINFSIPKKKTQQHLQSLYQPIPKAWSPLHYLLSPSDTALYPPPQKQYYTLLPSLSDKVSQKSNTGRPTETLSHLHHWTSLLHCWPPQWKQHFVLFADDDWVYCASARAGVVAWASNKWGLYKHR